MTAQWYVGRDGQQSGPFSVDQLREMRSRGELSPGDLVWKQGMAEWVDCTAVGEISGGGRPARPAPRSAEWNPYQSPSIAADLAPAGFSPGDRVEYANYLPRVGAALLDGIFVTLITIIPAFLLGLFASAGVGGEAGVAIASLLGNLLGLVVGITYYVGLETSEKQGTWGKQILGIRVTDLEGRRLTFWRALGRYFAKILSGCSMGIGWLMPLFTEKRQTLHDMICGCLALKR